MGPLRVNFSRGGVGASVGVRGARVGVGPRGTYVNFGVGGFQYRTKVGGSSSPKTSALPSPASTPVASPTPAASGNLSGASAAELAVTSPEWMVEDLQRALTRANLFKLYCWVASIGFLWIWVSSSGGAAFVVLLFALGFGILLYRWDSERRTSRVIYDVDNDEVVERFAMANGAGQWLGSCQALWHIFHAERTSDWKTNAGAGTLIRRTNTRCVTGSLPRFELNIEVWCVPVGPQQLLFLPDRLLVWDGRHLAAVPYEMMTAQASSSRFIEEGGRLPSDAQQVDSTWRYVNKNGGPDRRFNNNAQLPVMRYGELVLSSPHGLVVVLQTSTVEAAEGAARALSALSQRARAPQQVIHSPVPQPTAHVAPAAMPALGPPEQHAVRMASSVAILLRHLAGADRRIDAAEIAYAHHVLGQLLPPSHPELARLSAEFRTVAADAARVLEAVQSVRHAGAEYSHWVVSALDAMSTADGKATPKEIERLVELRQALGVGIS